MPLKSDTAAINALLPLVLKRGCEGYPDMTAINRRLKELYGARLDGGIFKRGEVQIITLYCEALDDSFTLNNEELLQNCASLLKSVIFNPTLKDGVFDSENVEIEKRNLGDIIDSQLNDKRQYASIRLKEEMCREEAFGVSEYGKKEEALAITPADLFEGWKNILSKAKTEIFLVGPGESTEVEKLFTDAFKAIDRKQLLDCPTKVIKEPKEVRTIEERLQINQAKLVMGFRSGSATPDEDVPSMQLACTIFGGSPHSKLFANVREKLSLCYYCYSRFERQKGLVFVDSGIEEENFDKAKAEILKQLDEVKQGTFTDDDMKFAAMSLENSYKELNDTLYDITGWYLGQAVSGKIRTPAEAAQEIMNVKRDEVVAAAGKIKLDTVYLLAGIKE